MNTTAPTVRVLVVDDEPSLLDDYRIILDNAPSSGTKAKLAELEADLFRSDHAHAKLGDIALTACQQGADAIAAVSKSIKDDRPFAVAFLDLRMPPGLHGLETAEKIRAIDPNLYLVFVTAYSDVHSLDIAEQVPPADRIFFIHKPFHALEIQQLVNGLSARWRDERVSRRTKHTEPTGPSRQQFDPVTENLPAGLAVFDQNDRLISVNDEIRSYYGDASMTFRPGTSYAQFLDQIREGALDDTRLVRAETWLRSRLDWHRSPRGSIEQALQGGRTVSVLERKAADGRTFALHVDTSDLVARLREDSDREVLLELRQGIGECAASLNTHFTTVSKALTEAVKLLAPDGERSPETQAGIFALRQTQSLLNRMLEVAQRRTHVEAVVDVGDVVKRTLLDLKPLLGKTVKLDIKISDKLWPVALDIDLLRHALSELADNAIASERAGGLIRIRIENANSRSAEREEEGVLISVSDNGLGMRPEIRARALRPFFTTRRAEGRLGLGLAAVHSFVLQSSGNLKIESHEGLGTTVRLFFPKHGGAQSAQDAGSDVHST
ncbi:MAG: ATP-binding protein [Kiloniellales bacterium]